MELPVHQIDEIKRILNSYYSDVDITMVDLQDTCGCYSEYTTDSCCLHIEFHYTGSAADNYRMDAENAVRNWGNRNLDIIGCSCCSGAEDDPAGTDYSGMNALLSMWIYAKPRKGN